MTNQDGVHLFHGTGLTAGFASACSGVNLETATADLYRRLFAATAGLLSSGRFYYIGPSLRDIAFAFRCVVVVSAP